MSTSGFYSFPRWGPADDEDHEEENGPPPPPYSAAPPPMANFTPLPMSPTPLRNSFTPSSPSPSPFPPPASSNSSGAPPLSPQSSMHRYVHERLAPALRQLSLSSSSPLAIPPPPPQNPSSSRKSHNKEASSTFFTSSRTANANDQDTPLLLLLLPLLTDAFDRALSRITTTTTTTNKRLAINITLIPPLPRQQSETSDEPAERKWNLASDDEADGPAWLEAAALAPGRTLEETVFLGGDGDGGGGGGEKGAGEPLRTWSTARLWWQDEWMAKRLAEKLQRAGEAAAAAEDGPSAAAAAAAAAGTTPYYAFKVRAQEVSLRRQNDFGIWETMSGWALVVSAMEM